MFIETESTSSESEANIHPESALLINRNERTNEEGFKFTHSSLPADAQQIILTACAAEAQAVECYVENVFAWVNKRCEIYK